jgi:hypothetical protein
MHYPSARWNIFGDSTVLKCLLCVKGIQYSPSFELSATVESPRKFIAGSACRLSLIKTALACIFKIFLVNFILRYRNLTVFDTDFANCNHSPDGINSDFSCVQNDFEAPSSGWGYCRLSSLYPLLPSIFYLLPHSRVESQNLLNFFVEQLIDSILKILSGNEG